MWKLLFSGDPFLFLSVGKQHRAFSSRFNNHFAFSTPLEEAKYFSKISVHFNVGM